MDRKGNQLEFISLINRDGKGVSIAGEESPDGIENKDLSHLQNDRFDLHPLSLTKETFIAYGFNVYVVKIKEDE